MGLAAVAALAGAAPGAAVLTRADFDVVAYKWNSGESAADVPIGVQATPEPVLEGAVNLMRLDGEMALYLTSGPSSGGFVLFGFVDATVWTPANGDGKDLTTETESLGDRVYARIDSSGNVELRSASDFSSGVVIGSAAVVLDPNKAWWLDVVDDTARLFHDGELLIAGPIGIPGGADPNALGNDLVISVTTGSGDNGSATINDLAHDPKLRLTFFPRLMEPHGIEHHGADFRLSLGRDVLNTTESQPVDLAMMITNAGSATASDLQVRLVVPSGVGITVVGSDVRSYGSIPSGASTARAFRVQTAGTPVGVHELLLEVTGGVTHTLPAPIAVWDLAATVTDLATGAATATAATPFAASDLVLTMPEIITFPTDEPFTFQLSYLRDEIIHDHPFQGVHWGDGVAGDLEFVAELRRMQATESQSFNLTVDVKTRSGSPLMGCGVTVQSSAGSYLHQWTSADGTATFPGLSTEENPWQVKVRCNEISDLYGQSVAVISPEPGTWIHPVRYPDLFASGVPGNSLGQNGGQGAGIRGGGCACKLGRSTSVGVKTFVAGGILDALGILAGGGLGSAPLAWVLSATASALAGSAAAEAADPIEQDLYFHGQMHTPPLDPQELTTWEAIELDVDIVPPPSFRRGSVINTAYTYTRVTDQRTYTHTGTESLPFSRYLPLDLGSSSGAYDPGDLVEITVRPATAMGQTLTGPEVLLTVLVLSADGLVFHTQLMLQDDGQAPDAAAGDGTYSATLDTSGMDDDLRLVAWAARTGFYQPQVPPSFGWEYLFLRIGAIFADDFESGGTTRWSASIP